MSGRRWNQHLGLAVTPNDLIRIVGSEPVAKQSDQHENGQDDERNGCEPIPFETVPNVLKSHDQETPASALVRRVRGSRAAANMSAAK